METSTPKINTFPSDTIHSIFERQAFNFPEEYAIICDNNKLTYKQLNDLSNKLANYIKSIADIQPDDLIAVCLPRSEYLIVCLLAILKSGGAYVPLDTNLPNERISYIINDTKPKLILCDQPNIFNKVSSPYSKQLVVVNDELKVLLDEYSDAQPISITKNTNLAYVIYTSGTTGTPKGVMVEHNSYIALINSLKNLYFSRNEKVSTYSVTNFVFDIFGLEYGLPLFSGGTLTLGKKEFHSLDVSKYSFIQMTPSFLTLKLNDILPSSTCYLFVGGESLKKGLLKKSLTKFTRVINLYGPTETTIWSLHKKYNAFEEVITIGKAFEQENAYVLNEKMEATTQNEIGEIYIGGIGLARGYLNLPELTAEKFIYSPFGKYERLYKTGDLGRKLANGEIQFVGRNDSQIKFRGYRIELGEIESALSEILEIKQAALLVKNYNNIDYLVCYYTANELIDEKQIIDFLKIKLPDYMIPQHYIFLKSLPLTINGKLDIKALPEVNIRHFSTNYVKPLSTIEIKITKIWSDVLGINPEEIGLNDDFFKLGGTSINAIKLASIINKHYKSQYTILDIYNNSSLSEFINLINTKINCYIPIIKFGQPEIISNKPEFFFIHPGAGGCEVYSSLAGMLQDFFNCYGIESYNFYNSNKISNLNELANKYLNDIYSYHAFCKNKQWNFLGWSLGGQIALEIAAILEEKEKINANVFLLDTMLNDNELFKLRSEMNIKPLIKEVYETSLAKGYPKDYINLLTSTLEVEHELICQNISKPIKHTKIYLFKAALTEKVTKQERQEVVDYMSTLKNNNIDLFINNADLLNVIPINDVKHENILTKSDFISKTIKNILI